MSWLSDAAVARMREVVSAVDFDHPRYRLEALIGRGGMGAVYLALDRELERPVALKLIDSPGAPPDAERRLLAEARVLAKLEHPGIVPVHDAGTLADGRVFCVMKRVSGQRLDDPELAARPLAERLRIFERICEAVAFAHAAGVIHRDLKPANVMVGAFGEVLVLDWGLALVLQGEPLADGQAVRAGTAGYMAPEQMAEGPAPIDARADVHALGGLLGFLLTGVHPPTGGEWPPFRQTPDRRLAAIIHRARAADRSARYPTVAALADDVARFRSGDRVLAYRENGFEQVARYARRYQLPLLLVAAYLAMRLVLFFFIRR